MFDTVLVANRGEIACRVIRTLRELGIRSVAVYSDADRGAKHVADADTAVRIGPAAPQASYLSIPVIIEAARATGAQAIHPGYGFLSENADFARACADAGIVFIGPGVEALGLMGDKIHAKAHVAKAGVPVIQGVTSLGADGTPLSEGDLEKAAIGLGFPILIKPSAGGGGKGMQPVLEAGELTEALATARRVAKAAFGDDTLLLERLVTSPRHIEVQLLADAHGNTIHLGERECSLQRRHQKVIEEAPSVLLSGQTRARIGEAACTVARSVGYVGAGTVEFLVSDDAPDEFFFMEMNTRLQVEHPVTEAITGLDLVALQLLVASGRALPLRQEDVRFEGHAIEVRLCAEDPAQDFMPQSGTLLAWALADTVRVEHALRPGSDIPPFYDSMIAKLIAHGPDREAARLRLMRGLEKTVALGIRTNQAFLGDCLAHPTFIAGGATTGFIDAHRATLLPDREGEERAAAMRVAAMLRAGPGVSITHGFPASLRLKRGERVHAVRVVAGRLGQCRVECEGESVELRVVAVEGDQRMLVEEGRSLRARLLRRGGEVWARIGGRSWDFEDLTFEPATRAEAAGDGKVRASMNGRVVSLPVAVGEQVTRGRIVLVLEAMKMEHAHLAGVDGTVAAIHVSEGDQVEAHRVVVEVAAP